VLKNAQSNNVTDPTSTVTSTDTAASQPPVVNPIASVTVKSVQNRLASDFGATAADSKDTKLVAVTVTIKNLSSANQNFSISNFAAITDKGAIVQAIVWALGTPGVGNFWNNSTIVSGGTDTEVLTYPATNNLITLQFTDPTSQTVTSLPLTTPTN
jgi:hypothetical protein